MSAARKICIVGISGSGKTTLARRLSAELGLPHTDLDAVRFPEGKPESSPAAVAKVATEVATGSAWIAEGSYAQQMRPLFEAADLIIWMDTGSVRSAVRILTRHLRHTLRRRQRFSTTDTLGLAFLALRAGSRSAPSNQHATGWQHEIAAELNPYMSKVRRIGSLRVARHLNLNQQ